MTGLTILDRDERKVLAFDLRDILPLIGKKAYCSQWKVQNVEAIGGSGAEELHRLADENLPVSGDRLAELANATTQIVDGEFYAFLEDDRPWLIVRAVDSSAFDIETDDPHILEALRERFSDICEIPS
jgi:hypothetical protein